MAQQIPEAAIDPLTFFKLLADETRFKALLLLATVGELCVCELMCALDESQPKISRHLAMLRKAAVLKDRRQGQWVYYRLNPALAPWLLACLQHAAQAQPQLLAALSDKLSGMRPQRNVACC